jgi:hypothetical protein
MMTQQPDRGGEADATGVAPAIMSELREAMLWYDALDPTFKFLFALPFMVAAAGLLSHWVRVRFGNQVGDVEER